jgi:hypothetical protein
LIATVIELGTETTVSRAAPDSLFDDCPLWLTRYPSTKTAQYDAVSGAPLGHVAHATCSIGDDGIARRHEQHPVRRGQTGEWR